MGSSWVPNSVPADIWAASARTLTDFSAEEIFDLPELTVNYPSLTVVSAAGAGSFGSWVEVSADVGVRKRLVGLSLQATEETVVSIHFELGEGGPGSESKITAVPSHVTAFSAAGLLQPHFVSVWRSLTDNARLSIRVRDESGGARAYAISALVA